MGVWPSVRTLWKGDSMQNSKTFSLGVGESYTCTCATIFMYTRARAVAVALPPALAALCSSYIPSEAAQFFSLSAFGLCLTSLVLICIYMYEIDHACTCTCSWPGLRVFCIADQSQCKDWSHYNPLLCSCVWCTCMAIGSLLSTACEPFSVP